MSLDHGRILYLSDKYGIASGYEPGFNRMLGALGLQRSRILVQNIYALTGDCLRRYGNEKTWKFDIDKRETIQKAVDIRITATKPTLIVCADPAALGVFVDFDIISGSLDKCRGGVYNYRGIPVVVTYPITVIHTKVDERVLKDQNEEEVGYEPYKIKQGAWIHQRDWEKISRVYKGKSRRFSPFRYSITRTVDDLYRARDSLLGAHAIAVDIETGCWPAQITCVGYSGLFADGSIRTFVIPFFDPFKDGGVYWAAEHDHLIALSIVREINESPVLKILQNGNYDASYFVRDRLGLDGFLLDTMLMWYSMYMELPKSLDFISSILLDHFQYWKDDIKGEEEKDEIKGNLERYWRYNGLDTYYTLCNAMLLMQMFAKSEGLRRVYLDTFLRAMSGLQMSLRGVKADFKKRNEHRLALEDEKRIAEQRFRYLIADGDFNVNSPDQKIQLLYDVLGVRERNAKGRFVDPHKPRTGLNKPSSGAIALRAAKTDHPLFKRVIGAMEDVMVPDKQMGLITGRWNEKEQRVTGGMKLFTDRVRTSYNAAATVTTRFGSKGSAYWDGGNLQNIRGEFRDWLVADPGCILVDADYSQSDDVFVGYEANDPDKIKVIESGVDGHAVHGELFFKRPYAEIVAGKKAGLLEIVHPIFGIRQLAKRVVHGTNFQMAAITLFMTMGREAVVAAMVLLGFKDAEAWPQVRLIKGCEELMKAYRRKYKRLNKNEWYKEIEQALVKSQQLTNAFGITRKFLGDPKDNGTQREATGFIGQSDTSGNMNRTMYEIDWGWMPKHFRDGENPDWGDTPRRMTLESHGFRFLLQTHDSFIAQLSLDHPRWREAVENLLHVMERPVVINGHVVRVKTETKFGLRWGNQMIPWDRNLSTLEDTVLRALQCG